MQKTVLVTGAAEGTGYAIARRFAREGCRVILTSREDKRAREAAARLTAETGGAARVEGFGMAPSQGEQRIREVFDAVRAGGGLVNAVVLCAAHLAIGLPNVLDIPYEDWMEVVNTNIGWNFCIARQGALHMKQAGGGAIVFIGSVTAVRAIRGRSAYIASKGGIHAMSRALACDLGPYGIRVNTVIAGSIKTKRWQAHPENRSKGVNDVPLGDVCEFEDIANAAWYLASDGARVTTGAELAVDGGLLAQLVAEERA